MKTVRMLVTPAELEQMRTNPVVVQCSCCTMTMWLQPSTKVGEGGRLLCDDCAEETP